MQRGAWVISGGIAALVLLIAGLAVLAADAMQASVAGVASAALTVLPLAGVYVGQARSGAVDGRYGLPPLLAYACVVVALEVRALSLARTTSGFLLPVLGLLAMAFLLTELGRAVHRRRS